MHPSEGALLPLLAHVEPPALPGVLDRVRALVGDDRFGEALRAERPHPDPFVGALARHLPPHLLVDLAADPCLTPAQLTAVIEAHGGNAVVRATFHDSPDDTEPPRTEGPAADLDAARARIRADGCDAATAAALLRAHPVLAWTGRDPALARVLHGPDHVFDSAVGTRRPLLRALLTGAVTLGDLTERIRPAQLCVQWFAWVWREESREVPRPAVAACLRDHVGRALGTDPRAWAAFARLLGRHRGTLADLAADAAADAVAEAAPAGPGEPRIVVAKGARPAFGFLLRTMDIAVKAALLDHLDDEFAAGALVPGDVQPDPEVLDLALTRRHHALLAAFARHQYLGEARGRRIAALDDRALDLVLVANQAGVGAALRREIVAGTAHGTDRPREPLDDDLRLWAIAAATPGTGTGYVVDRVAFALSGDPALVTLGLPRCGRLRRVD